MPAFAPYPAASLPDGFRYPQQIAQFANAEASAHLYPWWFVDAASDAGRLFWSVRKHDGRNLIPFAKVDDGRNDVACFDGDDRSGDPAVLMLVLDGSGRSYRYENFAEWLAAVKSDVAPGQD